MQNNSQKKDPLLIALSIAAATLIVCGCVLAVIGTIGFLV